ncbi:MAG: DEAD/DEAH box helicase family protein [Patescibacteria group bacterium]
MKLQFDPNQEYQKQAISAIVDIFEGQPLHKGDFEIEMKNPEDQLQFGTDFLVGNNLILAEETILQNLNFVQKRNQLEESKKLDGLNFSVEMETGTGKTYVYLRTIHELHKKYGFKKFIIVVPGIAIKEGVVKNLKITQEHFANLYENPEMDFYVYDPRKRGQLKNFATTNALQILVINIDSFAKFSEEKAGRNVIYQDSDWGIPIEYIQGVRPIVIVDEPQNMETEIRKKAVENLNPLCTLRYSATHKFHYNLIYRLNPVQAYDMGLVKKIEVDSVITEENHNEAFVELVSVKSLKNSITIRLKIDVNADGGVKKKIISIRKTPKQTSESDLFKLSGEREIYRDGYIIDEVDVAGQSITFSNGKTIFVGQTVGGMNDEIMKYQIQKTVQNHFEKEQRLKAKGIKVLSLFFIDRVANYREYSEAGVVKGKIAKWFEEAFREISKNPRYQNLIPYSVEKVHNGYFSQDKKGVLKDTQGNTKVDDDTYSLIMKDKERLLSMEEPLRFIFSHSALREGWDNPNVFQICTLNESRSEMKKRQEIGRGLRLPVNQDGQRIFDSNLNILTVTANESYEDFAKSLQKEIEQECGVKFGSRVKNARDRKKLNLKKGYALDSNFRDLWERIKHKTRYQVSYDTKKLISEAGKAISEIEITSPKIKSFRARLNITDEGVEAGITNIGREKSVKVKITSIPDILGYIQDKTKLTKDTILRIIAKSGKMQSIFKNPQQFMDVASVAISRKLNEMMVDGIKYEKIAGEVYEMKLFENDELEGYLENMVKVQNQEKTLYDYFLVDSEIEDQFAKDMEIREDVKFYIKLPSWFKIKTPIGDYNPDWAVILENDKRIYFVAETKGTSEIEKLRGDEKAKVRCGKRHFDEFEDVKFEQVTSASELAIE